MQFITTSHWLLLEIRKNFWHILWGQSKYMLHVIRIFNKIVSFTRRFYKTDRRSNTIYVKLWKTTKSATPVVGMVWPSEKSSGCQQPNELQHCYTNSTGIAYLHFPHSYVLIWNSFNSKTFYRRRRYLDGVFIIKVLNNKTIFLLLFLLVVL